MLRHAFIIFILLAWVLAFGAQGATLSYDPVAVSVTLEPGQSWSSPLTVDLQDVAPGGYNLIFISAVVDGNLPMEWLEPAVDIAYVTSLSPTAQTTLAVNVPKDAKPGTYAGRVLSTAMGRGGDLLEPGTGVFVSLNIVGGAVGCAGIPEFAGTSVGPERLWAPNNKLVDIEISGTLDIPDGCQLGNAWYEIVDEYGEFSGTGPLNATGGSYSESIPVEASRNGQDKDGRTYSITLFAENSAGLAHSETITVTVSHDQRK